MCVTEDRLPSRFLLSWSPPSSSELALALPIQRFPPDMLSSSLDFSLRRVGERIWRQVFRHVKARHADPVVCHPVINVEAIR